MGEKPFELRDYGSEPFKVGEIDAHVFQTTLKNQRKVDLFMLGQLGVGLDQLQGLNEEDVVRAFNNTIDSDFFVQVDGDFLPLRDEIRRLLGLAREIAKKGEPLDPQLRRTLNRALLHAVYPKETLKSRQYERFAVPEMLKTSVTISGLGAADRCYKGKLMNISLGGMALLLPEQLTEGTYWALKIVFAGNSEIETLVQIRHSLPQQGQFLHGFQFVSIPSFLGEQVELIARDYSACEERIRQNVGEVCLLPCSFYSHCSKIQKRKTA